MRATRRKISPLFWQDKTVLVTGHTGFKGTWLSLWLMQLGARVIGYSLAPKAEPNLHALTKTASMLQHVVGDIRNYASVLETIKTHRPDIVIHLAAQPLVLTSYQDPIETYSTNVMGTVNLLEALRQVQCARAFINITTDKCYENKESDSGYQEEDKLGGFDPYSNSKACSELVTQAYYHSFLAKEKLGVATARAGNVIGGGDWALNRLVPDVIRGCIANQDILIRHPESVRPWQHVLDPLQGYLLLAQQLYLEPGQYSSAWNFGPADEDTRSVSYVTDCILKKWGNNLAWKKEQAEKLHESQLLKLNSSKARAQLGWQPNWNLAQALDKTVSWYKSYHLGEDLLQLTHAQISDYMQDAARLTVEAE